jgi:hypothetical protein
MIGNNKSEAPRLEFINESVLSRGDVGEAQEPRRGDACPKCGKGKLDYDGLLNLRCEACGFAVVGCFT